MSFEIDILLNILLFKRLCHTGWIDRKRKTDQWVKNVNVVLFDSLGFGPNNCPKTNSGVAGHYFEFLMLSLISMCENF